MDMMEQLSRIGIVPVIAINDAADAVPLAQALIDGGLPCRGGHLPHCRCRGRDQEHDRSSSRIWSSAPAPCSPASRWIALSPRARSSSFPRA